MRNARILVVVFALVSLVALSSASRAEEKRPFLPEGIHRIQDVRNVTVSPEGDWVAYTVRQTRVEKDDFVSDLYMVSWDGETRLRLTHNDKSESNPRFSPDGRYLAFITARGDSDDEDDPKTDSQVWLLPRVGGEAERLTEMKGGVSSFEWSPDSKRLVLVVQDPEPDDEDEVEEEGEDADEGEGDSEADGEEAGEPTHDTPKPIVIDRYQFKRDREGYLQDRYERLWVFDVESREATLLTPGNFDSTSPSWSPDSTRIAFTSRRGEDPDRHRNSDIYVIEAREGAEAKQVTTWGGPDTSPSFSPDGTKIVYLQGGPEKYSGYDPEQVAVISAEGGEVFLPTADLDRASSSPKWSVDGSEIHFIFQDDRQRYLASVPAGGGELERLFPTEGGFVGVVYSFAVGAKGLVGRVSGPQNPTEIFRLPEGLALTDHNRELVDSIEWATVEGFDAVGPDGVRVGSMLLKPPGWEPGKPYPTIAHVHGGPVSQDAFEFDNRSQVLAAQGYLVVNPNYRGSSGRGRDFSRAIYAEWGGLEIQDIHAVMDALVEQGLADPDRLGIGGWSYGGMNTNYAIATDTRFAAAVSGSAISNAITGYGTDQYIWQYENEIGLPWEGIDGYLKISYPFFHADRIETPTLFMCGEKDFNVPLINSEQMYQALRTLGVPTQLVIYPGQYHSLSKPSYIEDRMERMIDWFSRYLDMPKIAEPVSGR